MPARTDFIAAAVRDKRSHGQTVTSQKSGEDLLPALPGGTLFNGILGRIIGL